ncbi:DUF4878 domain-containing protein [Chitinophaga sp. MAH-28]|uniref:DUF4878 domain-containing protein n=2 Tax=Chitinophagaceae TaxID=563835 RepID=A0ABS3YGQ3_9BACT|nr:DUF4878 domain-containing protein [Chitinophaga chungangae]MBO9153856.1 DUF4878 domain-containing protein [Chitinophaga chungangae]
MCVSGIFLTGCKKRPEPQEVALEFMHAIQASNFERAKEFATKESQQVILLYSIFDGKRNENEREKIKNAKLEVVNHQENGDKATVTILNSSASQQETLQLVKESGQWKISLTLESILPTYVAPGSMDMNSMAPQNTDSSTAH